MARYYLQKRNVRILQAVAVAGTQRGLQIIVTLVTIPLILRSLGEAGFGLWAAATSLSWIAGMLDLGLGAALVMFVSEATAAQRVEAAREPVTAGLLGTSLMGVVVLIIGGAVVYFCALGADRAAFLVAIVSIAVTIPLSMNGAIWLGLQKAHIGNGWAMAQTLLNFAGLLLAVFTHAGTTIMVAAFYGSTILASVFSLLHLFIANPEIRPRRLVLPADIWRQIMSKGALFAAMSVAGGLSFVLDNVIALALLGPLAAARIGIALRVGINAMGLIGAFTAPLWPAFVDARVKGDQAWTRRTLLGGTAAVAALALAGGVLMVSFGTPFLQWWLHDDIGVKQNLLLVVAIWAFALSLPSVFGTLLNSQGILKFQLFISIASSAFALLLKVLLARRFGDAGVLLAAPLSCVLIVYPLYAWRTREVWWRRG